MFGLKCWFFQRNPDRFSWRDNAEIDNALTESERLDKPFAQFSGISEDWTAERLFREMQPGDVAYFWSSGHQGGLEGWGQILDSAENDGLGYWIPVDINVLLTEAISRDDVGKGPAMSGHAFFTGGAAGANHRCDAAQALELNALLKIRGVPFPDTDKAEQNLPKGQTAEAKKEGNTNTTLSATARVAAQAGLSDRLTIDCERLIEMAVGILDQKQAMNDELSTTTIFLTAVEWSLSSEVDHSPPLGLARMTQVLRASGGGRLDTIRREFFHTVPPGVDFDLGRSVNHDFEVTTNLLNALKDAAQSTIGQVSAVDVLLSLLNHVGSANYTGNSFNKRFEGVVAYRDLEVALRPGTSTHVTNDLWTVHDRLGYGEYARAIYNFLLDPRTKPPLTISIQAPWGGGKTSLMRMIQRELDPDSQVVVEAKASPLQEYATNVNVKDLLDEVKSIAKGKPSEARINLHSENGIPTVWFNAWTYQNHKQVWAGLGEAIIRGLSERLDPVQREKFMLRLHMARIDPNVIRSKVYEAATQRFLGYLRGGAGLLIVGAGFLVGTALTWLDQGAALLGFGLGGSLAGLATYLKALKAIDSEPADVSLADYLDVPEYGEELGFVHRVTADLRRVLDILPMVHGPDGEARRAPIVLFVDDLDRCAPTEVAEVFEAINLFIAGEFPNCYVILGMDTEIVAAALEEAHKQVIQNLPKYSRQTAVGWRFMDKFVQLPFIIPPIGVDSVKSFANHLAATENLMAAKAQTQAAQEDHESLTAQVEGGDAYSSSESHTNPEDTSQPDIAALEIEKLKQEKSETAQKRKFIDEQAALLNQDTREIEALLETAYMSFSKNPRELKRLVNVYRFYMNLRIARIANGEHVPTQMQTRDWVILMLAWPEAYRWLRGGNHAGLEKAAGAVQMTGAQQMLAKLEETALSVVESNVNTDGKQEQGEIEFQSWMKALEVLSDLDRETHRWISDERLMLFFQRVARNGPEGSLARAAGKGFW